MEWRPEQARPEPLAGKHRACGRQRPAGAVQTGSCCFSTLACPCAIRACRDQALRFGSAVERRPRCITAMRSDRRISSSRSSDIRITPAPRSRAARRRLWTSEVAPTSRPRDGWAARTTCGSGSSVRASTIFWMLHRKGAVPGCPRPGSECRRFLSAAWLFRAWWKTAASRTAGSGLADGFDCKVLRNAHGARRCRRDDGLREYAQVPRRSSCARWQPVSSFPASAIVPDAGACRPEMTRASMVCPLPETPAIPRISPAFKVRSTSCRASLHHRQKCRPGSEGALPVIPCCAPSHDLVTDHEFRQFSEIAIGGRKIGHLASARRTATR